MDTGVQPSKQCEAKNHIGTGPELLTLPVPSKKDYFQIRDISQTYRYKEIEPKAIRTKGMRS